MPSNHWAFIYKKFHPEAPVIWFCHEPSAFIHSPAVIDSLGEPAETALRIAKPILSLLDKWLVKSADFIIANSQFTASQVKRVYGRIVDAVAYPAVNYNKFRSLNSKGNYIFTVNRLDKAKNIDVLIRAFAKLPSRFQEKFSVIIGGEGRERKSLERLAKNLHVLAKVKFLGEILDEDLPRWYARARLVVFASVDEPFGIIPLEAMASGTPVLATKTGGVQETVVEGETGFFVKPKDPSDLAKNIQQILVNDEKLLKVSKNCRNYVQKKFSWDKTVTVIEKLLVKAEAKIAKPTGRR
jgi:glycosyltransferase involved in cell wall biosynthesis